MEELHSFQGGTEEGYSLPTEYKGVIYMGEGGGVEGIGRITWFSGGSGGVIIRRQQSFKGGIM